MKQPLDGHLTAATGDIPRIEFWGRPRGWIPIYYIYIYIYITILLNQNSIPLISCFSSILVKANTNRISEHRQKNERKLFAIKLDRRAALQASWITYCFQYDNSKAVYMRIVAMTTAPSKRKYGDGHKAMGVEWEQAKCGSSNIATLSRTTFGGKKTLT